MDRRMETETGRRRGRSALYTFASQFAKRRRQARCADPAIQEERVANRTISESSAVRRHDNSAITDQSVIDVSVSLTAAGGGGVVRCRWKGIVGRLTKRDRESSNREITYLADNKNVFESDRSPGCARTSCSPPVRYGEDICNQATN